MAGASPEERLDIYDKRAKDKVRKSGSSAQRKVIQLGEIGRVFSAVVYFNPTYGRLDGAVHLPEGQDIPDLNGFLAELLNGPCGADSRHDPQRAQTCRRLSQSIRLSSFPMHNKIAVDTRSSAIDAAADAKAEVPRADSINSTSAARIGDSNTSDDRTLRAARDTNGRMQSDWRMADDSAARNASRYVGKHEVPACACAEGVSGVDRPAGILTADTLRGLDIPEAGSKVQSGRPGDVSEWETIHAQNVGAPTTQAAGAGLSRTQAVKAAQLRRFLRQVSLHIRQGAVTAPPDRSSR
ncbi:hypothetical protein CGMCC3_g12956 [Colletotrichum fructicola]|uniref:Uncharacterized protein n=1 Tax=Colletotrichum fructicola (strain Nara gc5) TaxID=1213859 RepID=A0A7J6IJ09_COLFN|nr:uncharacterized protein CGMCC3_g12956 [Colletotrichum fructicola]KAE9571071.1 hypothetical protein CGMCC3_g12956 [Colletotrichum fructicola]KAF4418999.1 hypothetical protein CFRS1_v015679 [Colletotrichum fructicola]KAF4475677.1 hypothetical protein CGGC5_v015966 [Colletotrichum fructicola Nara gc5]KAF4880953.1 hypothetical protein CGCFRS4_v016042 [Colletotrichum fructicola]